MEYKWYMLLDEEQNGWLWCAPHKQNPLWASQTFIRYFDAYEDAKEHGCSGTPAYCKRALFPHTRDNESGLRVGN